MPPRLKVIFPSPPTIVIVSTLCAKLPIDSATGPRAYSLGQPEQRQIYYELGVLALLYRGPFRGTISINLSFNIRGNSWSARQWVYTAVLSAS